MALSRTLYSTQFLTLYLDEAVNAYLPHLPIQSASIERTIPTEDILILGRLGSVGRQQKEVETVKMDIKLFWASGSKVNPNDANFSTSSDPRISASDIKTLTGNALLGKRSKIIVSPNGFTGFGILTNFSIDAGAGDFLTASMSFEGLGTPFIANNSSVANSASSYTPQAISVYTSQSVILGTANPTSSTNPTETIKSAKFSIDLPTERLTRIGAVITGLQNSAVFTGNNLLVAKPPFKVSTSYEGQLVTGSHALDAISFGHVKFTPKGSAITSQSFNQSAGEVGATMSFSSEGTFCDIDIQTF